MPTYNINLESVSRTTISVIDFLSNPSLRPRIENPDTRIPELIRCSGIVHYTRSGTQIVISDSSFMMQSGDFLVVAQSCPTGGAATVIGSLSRKDHIFVMPDNVEDPFALEAENYFTLKPNSNLVGWRPASLDRMFRAFYADDDINSPVNDLYIVAHANERGMLFRKDTRDTNEFLDYDELCDYIGLSSRPQITSRTIQNSASVHFRGCKIGRDSRFLTRFRELFGGQITVTAPKHIDVFGHRTDTTTEGGEIIEETIHNYEYMKYCFTVYSRTRLSNKNSVRRLFLAKNFADITGTLITSSQYNGWIPNSVNSSTRNRYSCTIQIPNVSVDREFRHRVVQVITTFIDYNSQEDIPTGNTDRLQALRTSLSQDPIMLLTDEYPVYQRWGYNNFNEFWEGLNWSTPVIDTITLRMTSIGSRHEYEIRIPITVPLEGGGKRLLLNAFQDPGRGSASSFLHHDILETDTRLFGRVP